MTTPFRRQYPAIPGPEFLSARLVELDLEARQVWARRSDAITERTHLGTEAAEEAAREQDRQEAAVKIRAGAPADQVAATPAFEALVKRRAELDAQIGASTSAVQAIETEMRDEFAKMLIDDQTSGRSALAKAEKAYRRAITSLAPARADYMQAKAVAAFIGGAACAAGYPSTAWPVADPGVSINQLSTVGERDYNLRPVSPEKLLAAFARDLDDEGTNK